jgi:hypothetical protein
MNEEEKVKTENKNTECHLTVERNSDEPEKIEDKSNPAALSIAFISPEEKFEKKVTQVFNENIKTIEEYIEYVKEISSKNLITKDAGNENLTWLNKIFRIFKPAKRVWKEKLLLLWHKKEVCEAADHLKAIKALYKVREEEFLNAYMPRFRKELEECNKNFDTLYAKSKHLCKYLAPNYYTTGISDYETKNPGNADLEWRVVFYAFMVKNIKDAEKNASRNSEYTPFAEK